MKFRLMNEEDINSVIPLYIEYYNKEDGEWTEKTVYKRIHQVLTREDSLCLICEEENGIVGFAMGYFEQFDELANTAKEKGALNIQLEAVNDEFHEHFYGKLGYNTVSNLVLKTKIL